MPPPQPTPPKSPVWDALSRTQQASTGAAVALTVVAGGAHLISPDTVTTFLVSAVALAALAAVVGQSIEQVGERFGPGATGLLQSALGNLPELFVGFFALRAGLVDVVRAALVGSILANTLLVLGVAVLAGGLKHGAQRFASDSPRMIGTLLLLAVAALGIPTLAASLHTAAAPHAEGLSSAVAVALVAVYVLSIPFWLRSGAVTGPDDTDDTTPTDTAATDTTATDTTPTDTTPTDTTPTDTTPTDTTPTDTAATDTAATDTAATYPEARPLWPLWLAITLLAVGSLGAALVSDWFVAALEPATTSLGISPIFTGLVIVAIASNAVENVGGVGFAVRAKPDYALSTILNSPLQIALFLTPLMVLISRLTGPTPLTLVFPTLEVAALFLAVLVVLVVLSDGEYVWLEGVALIGLYCIVAAAFWWG